MKKLICTVAIGALIAGCQSKSAKTEADQVEVETVSSEVIADEISSELQDQYNKFAKVDMDPDTAFLSDSERAVVNKLMEVSGLMNAIYFRQLDQNNPAYKDQIKNSDLPNKDLILQMFKQHYGVCDGLNEGKVFYGDAEACPKGGGFYPADMTTQEFEDWIAAHPDDEEAFRSGYTVIRREGDNLIAIPYAEAYAEWLEPAAALLREAAELSEEPTLKRFLNLRADAFLSDDYFESEMAWMDLEGNIEIAIGPYEVYDDGLFGYKTAYEMFLTVKNPEESAALAKYKDYLRDMEANLPVEDSYKNFKRGFESPIAVTYQVKGRRRQCAGRADNCF